MCSGLQKSLPGPFLLTEHDVGYVYLDVGCLQCSDFLSFCLYLCS